MTQATTIITTLSFCHINQQLPQNTPGRPVKSTSRFPEGRIFDTDADEFVISQTPS